MLSFPELNWKNRTGLEPNDQGFWPKNAVLGVVYNLDSTVILNYRTIQPDREIKYYSPESPILTQKNPDPN